MVLVDSSVWIEYFRGNSKTLPLNDLIDRNALCVNDLILAELLPSMHHKKETILRDLLSSVTKVPLDIDWNSIVGMQTRNLKNGINRVGLADLIIVQNVMANNLVLFSLDKHFSLMSSLHGFRLFT
jgi:predicted nucleic acid-binding protein